MTRLPPRIIGAREGPAWTIESRSEAACWTDLLHCGGFVFCVRVADRYLLDRHRGEVPGRAAPRADGAPPPQGVPGRTTLVASLPAGTGRTTPVAPRPAGPGHTTLVASLPAGPARTAQGPALSGPYAYVGPTGGAANATAGVTSSNGSPTCDVDELDPGAARTLIRDATAGAQKLAAILQQLAGNRNGLRNHPVTERFLEHAADRLTWVVDTASAGATYVELATSAGGQAGVALLGMAATRAQAAHVGLAILRPWCAFLQLHDRVAMFPVLQLEHRYRVLDREQRGVQAVLAQLTRLDPDEIATASAAVPGQVAALATTFEETIGDVEHAEKLQHRVLHVQLAAELLTFAAGLRGVFAMRGPPSARAFPMPALVGAGGGAATMGQVVVSAEWIAAIRHLVEIGAISAVSAAEALRVRGFTSAMAQATDLPPEVKALLGDGPTTDAMKVTNATGAGAARRPRHHVFPKEDRAFFEQRGFKGDLDIDNFTVELEVAHHQAQHGGGNWQMGRQKWPGEWNWLVKKTLDKREEELGRQMTVSEIMKIVEDLMTQRGIPLRFIPYRGQ
jgi:hypothetical protein